MMTGLGRAASKAFGPEASEIPWINFGKTRGSKPGIVGITEVPFWINPRNGFIVVASARTRGVKPLMASMVFPFFGVDALNPLMIL